MTVVLKGLKSGIFFVSFNRKVTKKCKKKKHTNKLIIKQLSFQG